MTPTKPIEIARDVTGVVLAGGQGKRLGRINKALIEFDGRSFIDRLVEVLSRVFEEVMVVANDPVAYADLPAAIVRDLEPNRGALMGLMTALYYAPTDWIFVTACDTPCLTPEVIRAVAAATEEPYRVVLSSTPDGLQPLTAAYHRRCLHRLMKMHHAGERSFRPLFKQVPVKILPPEAMVSIDPNLASFININASPDLDRLRLQGVVGCVPDDTPGRITVANKPHD